MFFFFNDPATTEIYTLSLHDALPISVPPPTGSCHRRLSRYALGHAVQAPRGPPPPHPAGSLPRPELARVRCRVRSEEHTSELQSRQYLVCRLLLEKKKTYTHSISFSF